MKRFPLLFKEPVKVMMLSKTNRGMKGSIRLH